MSLYAIPVDKAQPKLRHKEKVHDGQHDPIVPMELWEAVQGKLAASAAERRNATNDNSAAPLTGMFATGSIGPCRLRSP